MDWHNSFYTKTQYASMAVIVIVVPLLLLSSIEFNGHNNNPSFVKYALAQQRNISNSNVSPNTSPVAAVVIITKNDKGNLTFKPQTLTIKPGEEVFIGNNDTSPHSLTNGISSNDPLSGKLFDTGIIKAKGYAEFVASNLSPGKYQFYSKTEPSLKGEILVVPEK